MNALILMTRIPIPGKTKTRLMNIMSGNDCAGLHMAFLKDLFNTFENLKSHMDIYLTYTPKNSLSIIENIIPDFINTFPQRGEDLGSRMNNGIKDILSQGYEKVILIGSDIPHLKYEDILDSFQILDTNDIVLGPSYDGGYYLIGMKRVNEEIFHISKRWGGKSVLESTMEMANNRNLTVGLACKYMDIDTKEDLSAFMDTYQNAGEVVAPNTVKFIKEWREIVGQGETYRRNKTIY